MKQITIRKSVNYEGVGLFTGAPVKITLLPAASNSGVTFIRTDLPQRPRIPVSIDNVESLYRRTCLAKEGVRIETVEHFLAALAGLGIDNLEVEINSSELPAVDGSAQPFIDLLNQAGLAEQDAPKKVFPLKKPVSFTEKDISLIALPNDKPNLTIDYTLEYDAPLIGTQHRNIEINTPNFIKEIAPARTFCLTSEIDHFKAQGLGKGANYQNTLVVDKDKVVNNKLRFPDEFVRHKILDLIGDMYLLNTRLIGRVIAVKSGHEQNLIFVKRLAETVSETLTGTAPRTRAWLDIRELQNILPHRYPFLLIDKVIEMDGYQKAVGIKNVTINEPYFQGHFPGQPVMPAVLQIEAMAQMAGALLIRRAGNENKLGILLAIDKVKFRKTVVPGDQLRIEAETIRYKSRTAEVFTRALVDGELAAEAYLKFMLVDKNA